MDKKERKKHDQFFKEVWSDPEAARNFFESWLPSEILQFIDLDKLIICKDSFVTKELKEFFSDVLYKVGIGENDAYIYLLSEHKSYPEPFIHLQIKEYMHRIWRHEVKKNPSIKLLPAIFPLVIYHGEEAWNVDPRFSSIINVPDKRILKYIPDFEFILYDLSKIKDEEIRGDSVVRPVLFLMKHIFDQNIEEKFPEIFDPLSDIPYDRKLHYFQIMITYIFSGMRGIKEEDLKDTIEKAMHGNPAEAIMRGMEKKFNKIYEDGMHFGMQQGMQKGFIDGAKESLVEGLELAISIKFGETAETETALETIRSIEDLERLKALKSVIKEAENVKNLLNKLLS